MDARELFHLLGTDAGTNVMVDMRIDADRFWRCLGRSSATTSRGGSSTSTFSVARDEKIAVEVPINLIGESPASKEGGVVEHHLWTLHLESFPQDVPSVIEADISAWGSTSR